MLDYACADLIGLAIEIGLYGAYCVLFLIGIYVVFTKRTINPLLAFAGLINFVLSTAHIGLELRRASKAFMPDLTNPTVSFYTASPFGVLTSTAGYILTCNSFVVDAVLIWRCFALWDKNLWICVLPTLLAIGTAISAFCAVYFIEAGGHIAPVDALWGKACMGLSISTNILTTSLIAGRIWYMKRSFRYSPPSTTGRHTEELNLAMLLVVDTGVVYLLTIIVQLILFVMNSHAIQIVISALSQITGIVPTLIIVGGALGKMQHTEKLPIQPTQHPMFLRDTTSAPRNGLESPYDFKKRHSISPSSSMLSAFLPGKLRRLTHVQS